jgi:DNA polymerase-3 subunit gamma/tau
MRAFDLLAKAEQEIRNASHPRYHFEMVLLRWMHLRKLVPLTELLEQLGGGAVAPRGLSAGGSTARAPFAPPGVKSAAPVAARTVAPARPPVAASPSPGSVATRDSVPSRARATAAASEPPSAPLRQTATAPASGAAATAPAGAPAAGSASSLKDAFLAEVRAGKGFFYNTVVAQAQKIEVTAERVTFSFLPTHRALRDQFEQTRGWLEAAAERVTGHMVAVVAVQTETVPAASAATPVSSATTDAAEGGAGSGRDLKAEAMSSSAVQAMLDVFPAEIRDVEEIK